MVSVFVLGYRLYEHYVMLNDIVFVSLAGKSMDELNQLLQCNSISKNQKKKIMKQIKWNERIEDRR